MREMKIMIVDDEERFLLSMAKLLAKRGHQVATATSGQEALTKLAEEEMDVVVLDIKMPGMDGITTLKEIKKRRPQIEILMLTGHGTVDTALEAIQIGAFDYLMKPCSLDELLEKAQDAAEKKWIGEKK